MEFFKFMECSEGIEMEFFNFSLMHPDDEYDVFVLEADCDGPLRFTELSSDDLGTRSSL